jgi:hypothetical protein
MRSFLHIIQSSFSVFLDALAFSRLCLRPTVAVAAENLFCANNSASTSSERSNHGELAIRSDSLLPASPDGLIGRRLGSSSNLIP